MPDRYAVFGNPIAHSKSPEIHAAFARQTGQDLEYTAILAPLDGFADAVARFREDGGRGANVTIPFKEQAYALCQTRTTRAERAGAVNMLSFGPEGIRGDNTDGAALVADIVGNLGSPITGRRVLLLGAGGAARGVTGPLVELGPTLLYIANRTADKARELAARFSTLGPVTGGGLEQLAGQAFDLVINATAASLAGEVPALPDRLFAHASLAYDMMYGDGDTPFTAFARQHGADRVADGLGMLVEQAAEAFFVWRGVRPQTAPVMAQLRG